MANTEQGTPRFPTEVVIDLTNLDGNAFGVIEAVKTALEAEGATPEQLIQYRNDAMDGSFDHVLEVSRDWVALETV